MSTLVIVESPTKAKTIGKFLGKSYVVESSFGHVRDLPKSKMGVDTEGGTFEPTYRVPKEKTKQVAELKKKAKKAKKIIFATDEDREGEAIAWHLAQILDVDPKDAERIVFHEITKHAIDEALKHPRHINLDLVDAQQARRVLDRLVGYELSPLLWKKVARGLSAGRVQSVAVRLIVEREREIKAFNPVEYWSLQALFEAQKKHQFPAMLHAIDGATVKETDVGTESDMQKILDALKDATYTVSDITKKEAKRTPPAPFTTSTLQQASHNKYGYSSKQTMRLAQQLYEGIDIGHEQVGLITYMRTDSLNLSEKFLGEAKSTIEEMFGKKYTLESPRHFKNKSKGAQEAHEAIRPTDPARTPESLKDKLDGPQLKLYTLIWKRALATQMTEARMNKTAIDVEAKKYTFRANGQTLIFDGFMALYKDALKEELLPELTKGEVVDCLSLTPEQHFTKPPARYSDATLVKALEEFGIGRPSTYAPTIGTIEARGYVFRNDEKRLQPNDIAFVVNDLLCEHFASIVDINFTAGMEQELDDIAEGKDKWQPVIKTFYDPFHETVVQKTDELSKGEVTGARDLGIDPVSNKPISVRIGRYGAYVQKGSKEDEEKPIFASLEKGMSTETVTLEQALRLLSLPRIVGENSEGLPIEANRGRFGPYVKMGGKFYSLKEHNPYDITLEQALEVIKAKQEADANKIIKTFEGTTIQILHGRYGPYITDGEKNARIPKDTEPESLTQEQCETLLKDAKPARKGGWGRKKKAKD